ncbi:MAG: acetyl-CoA carboxylase carboxyltransferase subunit alpha [Armatimonadetes bacterium]|nr:acetyl-CoA carboxylase carboxyltransferase subunit alpha [Armatimonadota bacterium]
MNREAESPLVGLDGDLEELEERVGQLRKLAAGGAECAEELSRWEAEAEKLRREVAAAFKKATAWDQVQIARHPKRPYALDYAELAAEEFLEVRGDRRYGDDPAIVAGLARMDGRAIALIGHQKGRSAAERRRRNFGAARPEGYRKALRVMELAARWGRPILTLIDTPGADCLEEAESRGISEAIATCQQAMFDLPVPIVCIVIGEGGSGGAIAIGVGDRLLMLEHAYYSVIAPESCAAILWRNADKKQDMAAALKLTAQDALGLGVIDAIVPEPPIAAHRDPAAAAQALKAAALTAFAELDGLSPEKLLAERYAKFRRMGAVGV